MPQPLFLHIRTRGRDATRVVELSCDSIRIGRGSLCEVRIDDPSLAEVECFLRRRGETWHIQPLSPKGRMSIDGRPVLHLRAVAMNVPLRIGDATLVLRDAPLIMPAFGAIEVPPAGDPPMSVRGDELRDEERLGDRLYEPTRTVRSRHSPSIAIPQAPPQGDAPLTRARQASPARTWESRWRAVGRSLKLRTQAAPGLDLGTRSFDAPGEPATLPFTPRLMHSETRVDDSSLDERDPIEPDGCRDAEICWSIPGATPAAILHESIKFGSFDAPSPISLSAVIDPLHLASPDEGRETQPAPKPNAASRAEGSALTGRPADPGEHEWPSVRSILHAHETRRSDALPNRPSLKPRPTPTQETMPAHWSPASWLVALPMAGAIVVLGAVGIFLGATWGEDDRQAGLLADRLLRASSSERTPIAEEDVNPDGSWWRTTGSHLAIRAVALGSTRGEPSREETTRFLLQSARVAAPLEPATRIARAELSANDGGAESPLAALGLSRDTVALAVTARTLAREGKTRAALVAYRSALDLAARAAVGRGRVQTFLDEPNAKRFSLPFEGLIAGVIREMAAQPGWTYETWSASLPEHGVVLLAAYRVLSERGASESEAALNRLVECRAISSAGSQPLHSVARAEGLVIKGRWEDAASIYAQAITAMPDEAVRRTWHLNRGLILARNGAVDPAEDAMASARAGRGDDEIGRKIAPAMSREGIGRAPATAYRTLPSQRFRGN